MTWKSPGHLAPWTQFCEAQDCLWKTGMNGIPPKTTKFLTVIYNNAHELDKVEEKINEF